MRLDVTDLFDSFFAIATLAHRHFFRDGNEAVADDEPWDRFCDTLSDSYFLALVARRAFALTHTTIPAADIKRRIVTQIRLGAHGTLLNM